MDFINLKSQYEAYKEEIDREIRDVLDSQRFVLGEKGRQIEKELAEYVGVKHAIGTASGTDALIIALYALGVGRGDEIITTPFTFIATAEAVVLTGAKPVFVDIDPDTFNIDPKEVEEKITVKTRGIIAVDVFGNPADYSALREIADDYGLFILQDGAQSLGARRGGKRAPGMGDIGITSFFPAKPLGCFGEGGMIFTDSDDLAAKAVCLRNHGQTRKYVHKFIGKNSRLDEIQAAVLLAKLRHFEDELEKRQKIAERYARSLEGKVKLQKIEDGSFSTFAQFSILCDERDELLKFLSDRGIPTAVHYPIPLHLQECFEFLGYERGDFPHAEEISSKVISLPFSAFLSESDQDAVIKAVLHFLG